MNVSQLVFFAFVASIICGLIILLVKIRKSRNERAEIFDGIERAYAYSSARDNIIASRDISVTGPPDIDKDVWEVATLAKWITLQAAHCDDSKTLDDNDRFVAMLIALAAVDHLSSLANVSNEDAASVACISLNAELLGIPNSNGFDDALNAFNEMAVSPQRAKTLQAIGNHVALFICKNEDAQLIALRDLFNMLRRHVQSLK